MVNALQAKLQEQLYLADAAVILRRLPEPIQAPPSRVLRKLNIRSQF